MGNGTDGDRTVDGGPEQRPPMLVGHDHTVDARRLRVVVGKQMSREQRVDDIAAIDLGQMDVAEARQDVPEDRPVGCDGLPDDDVRRDVPVLEVPAVVRRDRHVVRVDIDHAAAGDRVDSRSVGGRDVDAVVEEKHARCARSAA